MKVMGVGEFLLHLFLFVRKGGRKWKRWSKIERKGVKRMVGEVDGGVRKKV